MPLCLPDYILILKLFCINSSNVAAALHERKSFFTRFQLEELLRDLRKNWIIYCKIWKEEETITYPHTRKSYRCNCGIMSRVCKYHNVLENFNKYPMQKKKNLFGRQKRKLNN